MRRFLCWLLGHKVAETNLLKMEMRHTINQIGDLADCIGSVLHGTQKSARPEPTCPCNRCKQEFTLEQLADFAKAGQLKHVWFNFE